SQQVAVANESRELVLLGDERARRCTGTREGAAVCGASDAICTGGAGGACGAGDPSGTGPPARGRQNNIYGLCDRRIAQSRGRATLVRHFQGHRELAATRMRDGDRADHIVVVDLLLAEILILLDLSGRQRQLPELGLRAVARGLDTGAIE